jgi:SAM-dependent methyltransferase
MPQADQQLDRIYGERFAGSEAHRQQVWQVLTRHFFQRWIPASAAVLDMGAGYCEFINQVSAARKFAMDLNPVTAQKAAGGVTVYGQSVSEPWPLGADSLDVVFTSNFLEHLPSKDDLHRALAEAHRVLRPGGRFIALGPNIRFCGDVYWDFIDHYLPLSDRSLAEALTTVGFRVETVVPRFLPYTMTGKKPSLTLVRLYLRLPLAWRILGKQFLVVAAKR